MAFAKGFTNKSGLNRKFGSSVAVDEESNTSTKSASKRIGTIKGRITVSKSGHSAGSGLLGNGNGLTRGFGNAVAVEEGGGSSPSRGRKPGG